MNQSERQPKKATWLAWCPRCKRRHRVEIDTCSECNVFDVPKPVSERVYDACGASYRCDGCEAYQDHLR